MLSCESQSEELKAAMKLSGKIKFIIYMVYDGGDQL